MKSAFDGLNGWQIEKLPPDERARRWEKDRRAVADRWFGGDVDTAQRAFDALPFSAMPVWADLDAVLSVFQSADSSNGDDR